MKKIFTLLSFTFLVGMANAQTPSTFDNLLPQIDTFLNGSDGTTLFNDGDAIFPTYYNTDWGYWASGWAISSMTDTLTAGAANLYSAIPRSGVQESLGYAVGQQGSSILLTDEGQLQPLKGLFITNTTYAYLSMKFGDDFAKKFGGETGDDPDFFVLTIKGFWQGEQTADSIDFYLADFRFEDNSQDYIVDSWEYVDLSSFGTVDSLSFTLNSTDVGDFGINTPLFFCIDQFNSTDITGIRTPRAQVNIAVYPNPTTEFVYVSTPPNGWIQIVSQQGRILKTIKTNGETMRLEMNNLPSGTYWIRYFDREQNGVVTVIKE